MSNKDPRSFHPNQEDFCSYCKKPSQFYQYFPNCSCHYCFTCLKEQVNATKCPTCDSDWDFISKEWPEKLIQEDKDQMQKGFAKCKYPLCSVYLRRVQKKQRIEHEKNCTYRTMICNQCGDNILVSKVDAHKKHCGKLIILESIIGRYIYTFYILFIEKS